MVTIYCIEDINDYCYVGSTKQELVKRLDQHRYRKRVNGVCSSKQLNLDYCIIYPLETCTEEESYEREKYWINHLNCVNIYKFNYTQKDWQQRNKKHLAEYQRNYARKKN